MGLIIKYVVIIIRLTNGEKVVREVPIRARDESGAIAFMKNVINDFLSLGIWEDGVPTEDNLYPIPKSFIPPNQIIGFEFLERIPKPEVKIESKSIIVPTVITEIKAKKPTFLSKKKDKNKK